MSSKLFYTLFTLATFPLITSQAFAGDWWWHRNSPASSVEVETKGNRHQEQIVKKEPHSINVLLEAKGAYFFPENSRFDKVFGGGGIYGLELSVQAWRNLYAWTSTDLFYKSGSSYGVGSPASTTMYFLPIGLGLKCYVPYRCFDFWLGAGALGTYMHVIQRATSVTPVICKWGAGAIVKGGILVHVTERFFIDIFSDYTFMTISNHDTRGGTVIPHDAHLNGWSVGGSLGWSFGSRLR